MYTYIDEPRIGFGSKEGKPNLQGLYMMLLGMVSMLLLYPWPMPIDPSFQLSLSMFVGVGFFAAAAPFQLRLTKFQSAHPREMLHLRVISALVAVAVVSGTIAMHMYPPDTPKMSFLILVTVMTTSVGFAALVLWVQGRAFAFVTTKPGYGIQIGSTYFHTEQLIGLQALYLPSGTGVVKTRQKILKGKNMILEFNDGTRQEYEIKGIGIFIAAPGLANYVQSGITVDDLIHELTVNVTRHIVAIAHTKSQQGFEENRFHDAPFIRNGQVEICVEAITNDSFTRVQ